MLNTVWMAMILLAFVGAAITGGLPALSRAAAQGAESAVETGLLLLGAMGLWSGLMRVAEEAGLAKKLSRLLAPLIGRLFPEYKKAPAVGEKISMNFAANLLGMGNAATPLGLAAMEEMRRISPGDVPTKGMILFVAMNTASFQLLPTSVVTLRASMGSADPYDVLPCIWLASLCGLLVVVMACKILERVPWRR